MRICRCFRGNAFTVESLSLFNAVNFCLAVGFDELIVEGDAKQVVDTLQGRNLNWNTGGQSIQDAKVLLQNSARWLAQHVPRRNNLVAHALAKDALISNVNSPDFEHIPSCIMNLVLLDIE